MSLAKCLNRSGVKLSKSVKKNLLSHHRELLRLGSTSRTAAIKVIRDLKSELKQEQSDIQKVIKETGTDIKFKKAPEKELFQGGGVKVQQFEDKYIGTGEGAQAVAWGHYLTSEEGVGQHYAKWGPGAVAREAGKRFVHTVKLKGNEYLDWMEATPKKWQKKILDAVQELQDKGKLFPGISGQAGINELEAALQSKYFGIVHDTLVRMNSPVLADKKAVAKFLKDLGMDGVSYPVGMLEGSEDLPGINYVVFDPKNIEVTSTKRYSKALPLDAAKTDKKQFLEDVKETIAILDKKAGPTRGTTVKVLNHPNSLPKRLKLDKSYDDIRGFNLDDTIYLFTDNLSTLQEAIATYVHEVVGHSGLEQFVKKYGMDYQHFTTSVYNLIKNTPQYKELNTLYAPETKGMSIEQKRTYLTEELLANRVEKLNPLQKRRLWTKIRDFFNTWLQKVFNTELPILSMKDIDLVLKAATTWTFSGKIRQNLEFARPTNYYVNTMKYMIENHPKALTWEANSEKLISDNFGNDAGIFNVLLALTSPGALVKTNAKWAVQTYLYMQGKLPNPVSRFPKVMKTRIDKLVKSRFYKESVKSDQFKVAEFIRAMLGDQRSTVNDRWMYRILFGPSRLTDAFLHKVAEGDVGMDDMDAGWTKQENFSARHKLFEITKELNKQGYKVAPAEVQAALWVRELQITSGNNAMFDYNEGLQTKSADLDGLTPIQYLHKMMGRDETGTLADKMVLGKLPNLSDLEIEYREWLKKEGIKKIDVEGYIPQQNPNYFSSETPGSLQVNHKNVGPAEFKKIIKSKPFAILTAENPNNTPLSIEENKKLNDKLIKGLKEGGWDYSPVEGNYMGTHEDSFFVVGMSQEDAMFFGKEFGQESVVVPAGLMYQDGTFNPADLGKINYNSNQTENYSMIRLNNKDLKFSIPMDFDNRVMEIVHFSNKADLTEIDPKYMGTGQIGAERSEINWETGEMFPGFLKKSNWYVPKDQKTMESHRFGDKPAFSATINVKDLYVHAPAAVEQMPDELKDSKAAKIFRDAAITAQQKPSDVALQKLGYKGWYSPGHGQVRLFEKVAVTKSAVSEKGKPLVSKTKKDTSGIRFKKHIDKVVNMTQKEAVAIDQQLASEDELGKTTFINRLWEWKDDAVHEASVLVGELEKEFYEQVGVAKKWTKRSMKTDLVQKALHLYLDTRANPQQVVDHYRKISKELKTAKGEEKIRLTDQKDIIEEMQNLTDNLKNWADTRLRTVYDDAFKNAQEGKVVGSFVEDYARRIWRAPKGKEDIWANYGVNKQRTLGSIIEGWDKGYDLKVEGALPALSSYMEEVATKIAQRQFKEYGVATKDSNGNAMFIPDKELAEELDYIKLTSPMFKIWTPQGWIYAKGKGAKLITTKDSFKGVFFSRPSESERTARVFEEKELYAPRDIADALNRMTKTDDLFTTTPVLGGLLRFNSGVKGMILSMSMFHYIAGARSWYFGVHGGKKNVFAAYKDGLAKVNALAPIIKLGVRNGLTLGAVQDFDAVLLSETKGIAESIAAKAGSVAVVNKLRQAKLLRTKFTNHMFKKWFMGLKAEAFSVEYTKALRKAQKKGASYDVDKIAADTASLINADFGGLHLKRMGRNPTLQKFARMFLLAPDWTESNFRTVTGALGMNQFINKAIGDQADTPGMKNTYRRFWAGIAIKGVLATVIAQAAVYTLAGDDDDSLKDFYGDQFFDNFKKGKWTTVDVSPILEKLGLEAESDKGFSLVGHFADPLKIADLPRLIKGKASPLVRQVDQLMTGSDWAERPFTSFEKLLETGKAVEKSRFQKKAGFYSRLPSTVLKGLEGMTPIQVQQATAYARGEEDGFSAILRSVGMHITNIRPVDAAGEKVGKIKAKVNELTRNLKDARKMKDPEAIREARQAIKDYKGYTRIKLKLKSLGRSLKTTNAKIKLMKKIRERKKKFTPTQTKRYNSLLEKKKKHNQRFMKMYNKL